MGHEVREGERPWGMQLIVAQDAHVRCCVYLLRVKKTVMPRPRWNKESGVEGHVSAVLDHVPCFPTPGALPCSRPSLRLQLLRRHIM